MRFLGVMALALVAATAAAAKPLPNACTLVPDAQLRSAIGPKLRHMAPPATNGAKMCVWQRTGFDVGPNPQLTLTVLPLDRATFTNKWNRKIAGVRPVSGVGEMAYALNGGEWLIAWRGGIEVVVDTTELKSPLETAKRVAKVAFSHL